MRKNWLYLVLGLALVLNSNYTVRAQEEGWWDVNSETDVTIDEAIETQPTATATEGSTENTENSAGTLTEEPEKEVITYTVVAGDTLSSIALRYLGSASRYPEIVALNPELISDPNIILTGWNLKIQLDGPVATAAGGTDAEPSVETSDESVSSSEVATEEEELTNAEKIAKLQGYIDSANSKLPAGYGVVDFTGNTVKFLVENGIVTKEELNALSPQDGYTWRISNGKVELVDAKNVALTSSEIALLDDRNALAKQAEEFNSSTSTSTLIEYSKRKAEVDRKLRQREEGNTKTNTGVSYGTSTSTLIAMSQKNNKTSTSTSNSTTTERKAGVFESAGRWLDNRIETARVTAVPKLINAVDTLNTIHKVATTPVRATFNGLVSGVKGFFVGGDGNGFINGFKNTFKDTVEDVKGLPGRCQERIDNALSNANGGSTTHTSSSGNTHGGSGGRF